MIAMHNSKKRVSLSLVKIIRYYFVRPDFIRFSAPVAPLPAFHWQSKQRSCGPLFKYLHQVVTNLKNNNGFRIFRHYIRRDQSAKVVSINLGRTSPLDL